MAWTRYLPGIALLAFIAVGVALCVHWLTVPPQHRINAESFERIAPGIPLRKVEALMGVPPGDYSEGGMRLLPLVPLDPVPGRGSKAWRSDELWVVVFTDQDGTVTGTRRFPVRVNERPGLHERLWTSFYFWTTVQR